MADERVISGRIEFAGNASDAISELNSNMDQSVGQIDSIETGMDDAADAADEAATSTDKWGAALTAVGAGLIASKITDFLGATLDAGIELEKQQVRVKALAGEDFPDLKDAIDATITSSQGLRAEGGLSEAAAAALQVGVSADVVSESLEGLSQISTVTGKDLTGLFAQVGQAIEAGTGGPLRKLGILNDDIFLKFGLAANTTLTQLDKETRQRVVLAAITEKQAALGDAFNDILDTAASKGDVFNEQMGNLFEIIGGALLPAFKAIMDVVNPFLLWLVNTEEGVKTLKIAMLIIAPIVGGILVAALVAATTAAWAFLSPILIAAAPIIGITAAILLLILIVDDLITFFQGGESVIGDFIEQFPILGLIFVPLITAIQFFITTFEIMWEIVSGIFNAIVALFQGDTDKAISILDDMGKNVLAIFSGFGTFLVDTFGAGFELALDFVVDLFFGFLDFVENNWLEILIGVFFGIPALLIDALFGLFPGLKGFFVDLALQFIDFGRRLLNFFASIPDQILDFFSGIGDGIADKFRDGLEFVKDLFPGSPVRVGPLRVLNTAGADMIDLLQAGINAAPPLDFGAAVPGTDGDAGLGPVGGLGQGGGISVNISAEFNFPGGGDLSDPSASRELGEDVTSRLNEWARTSLRAELGLA